MGNVKSLLSYTIDRVEDLPLRLRRSSSVMALRGAITQYVSQAEATRCIRSGRALVIAAYAGRVMERLDLASIVASEEVNSLVNPQVWKTVGRPIVVYKFHTALVALAGNWSQASHGASQEDILCVCAQKRFRPFLHGATGHVVTKDMSVVNCPALQEILEKGPTYRMRPCHVRAQGGLAGIKPLTPEERIEDMVDCALTKFCERQEEAHDVPEYMFAAWRGAILQAVRLKIGELTAEEHTDTLGWHPGSDGWPKGAEETLRALQKSFVVAVADKETGTFVLACRKHWTESLLTEIRQSGSYSWVGGGAQVVREERKEAKRSSEGPPPPPLAPPPPPPIHGVQPPTVRARTAVEVNEAERTLRAIGAYGVLALAVTRQYSQREITVA
jgi:hypothetical protein